MDQRVAQAVREREKGLLLQAGAGTGKTHWMAERYLALLEAGCSPLEVVAVTFTERAALELRNRIRKRILESKGEEKERLLAELEAAPIGTLHALAARICREFPEEAGVPADFRILDDLEAALLRREWVEEALRKELEEDQYKHRYGPLLETVGYEGLLETLEKIVEDPLAAQKLLKEGSRTWEELRKPVWAGLYCRVKGFLSGDPEVLERVPGLRQAWEAARKGDPETAIPLLEWADGIDLRRNPWNRLKGKYSFLEGLRELLVEENGLRGNRPAVGLLLDAWPQLRALVAGVLGRLEEHRFRARRLGSAALEVHALRALEKEGVREYY
ncbi:MAG: UvrD-helicase domain-containing protein, partial [Thermus sp.]